MNTAAQRMLMWSPAAPAMLMLSPTGKRNGWTAYHAIAAYVLVSLGVLVTWPAWVEIFSIAWNDEESSHIFLVPIIFVWLVWVRRERLRYCYPQGQWIGPVLIAAGWVWGSYGYYNARESFWHGGSVMIVVGCLISAVGRDVLFRFLPAFAMLVFLIPVPGMVRQFFALPLQSYLAQLTEFIFNTLGGAEVERNGNQLWINGQSVAIAEACNGLRMVFALFLVSFAFAFGTPLRNYVRFLIVAAAPVTALVCNIVRMIPTVWLYGLSESSVAGVDGKVMAQVFHDLAGWVMLIVAFLLLMSIVRVLRWALIPVTPYTLAYD